MKGMAVFLIGLLFCVGCAKDSDYTTDQIIQNDESNLIVITESTREMIKFEETSSLGRGDHIKVKQLVKVGPNHSLYERLKGKHFYITIGWIAKSRDGMFRYYEPVTNELNPMFTEKDLTVLKEKIRSQHHY